jgi:hypothetical protein
MNNWLFEFMPCSSPFVLDIIHFWKARLFFIIIVKVICFNFFFLALSIQDQILNLA